MAATYQYDPFGVPRAVTGDVSQPMQFSTKAYDDKTGLSYYGYRFYAASLGRWMTRDPIGEEGGVNLYGFVRNNPVNNFDPFGLYINQYPPSPPCFDPATWKPGQWDNGKWNLTSPEGDIYTAHPEDDYHWRHWDRQGPDGKGKDRTPPNCFKPSYGPKCKRSELDPSGDAPEWGPPSFLPFMPIDPVLPRIPIPGRIPIPIPAW